MSEIPKVDLHCHLEGAIPLDAFVEVGRAHAMGAPFSDAATLRPRVSAMPDDKTLEDMVRKFDTIGRMFVSRSVVRDLTMRVIEEAAKRNVAYLELRFSPLCMAQSHSITPEDAVLGVIEGVKRAKGAHVDVRLILIIERQMGVEPAHLVEALAEKYRDRGTVAIDLANDEIHYPPGPYADVFRRAKRAGLMVTVHAGETGSSRHVRDAVLELAADRIGHGVAAASDPETLDLLRTRGTTVEMCPTSNVQTRAVRTWPEHPIAGFLRAGLKATVNTDDPAFLGTTIDQEIERVAERFGLSIAEIERLVENGVDGAFLEPGAKARLRARVRRGFAAAERHLLKDMVVTTSCASPKPITRPPTGRRGDGSRRREEAR